MKEIMAVEAEFVYNASLYGKPVEVSKCWGDVISFFQFECHACCSILDLLESMNRFLRTVCKKRISIV